jgi:hypothetical protein
MVAAPAMNLKIFLPMGENPPDSFRPESKDNISPVSTIIPFLPSWPLPEEFLALDLLMLRSTSYCTIIVIIFTKTSNSTTPLTTTTSASTSVHHFLVSFKAPPSFTGLENVGHLYYNHIKITIKYNVSPNEKNSISIGCIQALLISIIIP